MNQSVSVAVTISTSSVSLASVAEEVGTDDEAVVVDTSEVAEIEAETEAVMTGSDEDDEIESVTVAFVVASLVAEAEAVGAGIELL